jgi:transposase
MGRVKKINITESAEELLATSRKVKDPLGQARLRAYYLYKTGQVQEYAAIAQQLGYERHAVGRWLQLYEQQGLSASLQINKTGNPKTSVVSQEVLAALRAKLSNPQSYFTSYKQVQQWLKEAHNITLQYSWVHEIVRYQLGAKLKVVRKTNVKKNPAYEEKFKKK